MDIPNKRQSLVSSATLIVLRSLLGLEDQVKWACEGKLSSGESNDSRAVIIGPS